jgi:hypothetical protein
MIMTERSRAALPSYKNNEPQALRDHGGFVVVEEVY